LLNVSVEFKICIISVMAGWESLWGM
jgi:hypothetical protein